MSKRRSKRILAELADLRVEVAACRVSTQVNKAEVESLRYMLTPYLSKLDAPAAASPTDRIGPLVTAVIAHGGQAVFAGHEDCGSVRVEYCGVCHKPYPDWSVSSRIICPGCLNQMTFPASGSPPAPVRTARMGV